MPLLAATAPPDAAQLVLAGLLAVGGFVLLLPRPRGRSVAGGTAALLAAAAVAGVWAHKAFGDPGTDAVARALFILFSCGAVGFGVVLVVQRNPARGAIAFAFVILSTCGLFLLLAAPFLMAATIIIYAGAIVVTFLFVLMLSHAAGPSDENDRTREPLLGSLAGFAFVGLVLFALHQTAGAQRKTVISSDLRDHSGPRAFPDPVLTDIERGKLNAVSDKLGQIDAILADGDLAGRQEELARLFDEADGELLQVLESIPIRLRTRVRVPNDRPDDMTGDPQAVAMLERVRSVRETAVRAFRNLEDNPLTARADVQQLRDEVRLLAGAGELPARNVANLGMVLYADHLLAVELAGTLLLVATIGAVAIAHRKGAAP